MATKFKDTFNIVVHPQGVNLVGLDPSELKSWIVKETTFNNQLEGIASTNLIINNTNYSRSHNSGIVQSLLKKILSLIENEGNHDAATAALEDYLEPARQMNRLLSEGPLSKELLGLVSSGKTELAHLPLLMFSNDFKNNNDQAQKFVQFHRLMSLIPFPATFTNLYAASSANEASKTAEKMMRDELAEVKELVETQKEEMARLHELYHAKLLIEAPAQHWQNVWRERTFQWRTWLTVFVIAMIVPAFIVMYNLKFLIDLLASLSPKDGAFSVAGLAVITAPALLYAWMLRQVSRIYTRSFDLAVDAAHRKALSVTFLGLAENVKLGVTQIDRSIILQALFRAQPPHLSDDGPPVGLLELIKSKE